MINAKKVYLAVLTGFLVLSFSRYVFAGGYSAGKEERKRNQQEALQEKFKWWPTDAQPGPVQDEEKGGYWWWPTTPGEMRPWGNRGYVYVYKIIFDYKEEELAPPKEEELRPSLLIKNIIKNVKIYFDYDQASLRNDATAILEKAVKTLKKNTDADILVTGNADIRGSEQYNEKLGRRRGEAVKQFMLEHGIPEGRILIVSRGKLDAVAPVTDLVGMQRDRNAQFMIAEVEEVMIPYRGKVPPGSDAIAIEEGKYMMDEKEEIEGEIKVSTREYTIQKGDTLGKIAQQYMGGAHRWKYLYEINKDRIKDPNKLPVGKKIIIPIEVGAGVAPEAENPAPPKVEEKIEDSKAEAPVGSPAATESIVASTQEYTVQTGDTLGEISMKLLGTSRRWQEIYELNKDKIPDPNKLIVGQKILIPAADKTE